MVGLRKLMFDWSFSRGEESATEPCTAEQTAHNVTFLDEKKLHEKVKSRILIMHSAERVLTTATCSRLSLHFAFCKNYIHVDPVTLLMATWTTWMFWCATGSGGTE